MKRITATILLIIALALSLIFITYYGMVSETINSYTGPTFPLSMSDRTSFDIFNWALCVICFVVILYGVLCILIKAPAQSYLSSIVQIGITSIVFIMVAPYVIAPFFSHYANNMTNLGMNPKIPLNICGTQYPQAGRLSMYQEPGSDKATAFCPATPSFSGMTQKIIHLKINDVQVPSLI